MKGIISTNTILDRIVARKIEEVAALKHLEGKVLIGAPRVDAPRDVASAVRGDTVRLIAEVKHASPSKGVLIDPFDPVGLATAYESGGAAMLSVLTDRDFFQGSMEDIQAVRQMVSLPVLRKDFIIDVLQFYGNGLMLPCDAALLIVAILDDAKLAELYAAMQQVFRLTPLVEVHTEAEMERALKLGAKLIGINNRDLHTFHVDLNVTARLAKMVPPDVTLVSESGIFTADDVRFVADAGAHAILVGESIVKSPDIGAQVRLLSSIPRNIPSSTPSKL
jgi:indole-3-glycerol phosphate synthase